jgi:signal transduction histidine kinase
MFKLKSKLESHYSISACSFYQIVSNIISNAIKYNDKEVLNLRICFDQDTSSLSFKDNGPEEKYHTKIFEMFQTLGKSFNEKVAQV